MLFLSVIPAIMALLIPIVAILGAYYVKIKKMEFEHKSNPDKNDDELKQLKKQLLYLEAEQDTLIHRIEQLEKTGRAQGLAIPETEEKIKIETKPFLRDNLGK